MLREQLKKEEELEARAQEEREIEELARRELEEQKRQMAILNK